MISLIFTNPVFDRKYTKPLNIFRNCGPYFLFISLKGLFMLNAIRYGVFIGAMSASWILLMHWSNTFTGEYDNLKDISWMEYLSVWIPFTGLYLGISRYRKTHYRGKMTFFEGLMQGLKILLVGGLLYVATLSIYIKYSHSALQKIDYLQRLSAVGVVGIILVLVVSLLLMTKPKDL